MLQLMFFKSKPMDILILNPNIFVGENSDNLMSDTGISEAENVSGTKWVLHKFSIIDAQLVNTTTSWLNMDRALQTNGHYYLQKVANQIHL